MEIPEMRQGQHNGSEKASEFVLRMGEANTHLTAPFEDTTILTFMLKGLKKGALKK